MIEKHSKLAATPSKLFIPADQDLRSAGLGGVLRNSKTQVTMMVEVAYLLASLKG